MKRIPDLNNFIWQELKDLKMSGKIDVHDIEISYFAGIISSGIVELNQQGKNILHICDLYFLDLNPFGLLIKSHRTLLHKQYPKYPKHLISFLSFLFFFFYQK